MYLSRQGSSIAIRTPAKLNLFLEVHARRPDGFHELETLITSISLFDTLLLSAPPPGAPASQLTLHTRWAAGLEAARAARRDRIVVNGGVGGSGASARSEWNDEPGVGVFGDLPREEDNLAFRAAERLRREVGERRGACLRLIKRIPAAAGLGGASSDAAAVLVGLNQLWRLQLDRSRLSALAAELGSDVPYFLSAGAAICRGRGERIEQLRGHGRLHVVVVKPPAGLATAAVYRQCRPAERPWSVSPLRQAFECGDAAAVGRHLKNRLQEPAEELSPWIGRLQHQFQKLDCLGHQMSGSGTTYFGLMRSARTARRAVGILRARGWEGAFAAVSVQAPAGSGDTVATPQGEG